MMIDPIPNTKTSDGEREDWARRALESLERAYGEAEPKYSLDCIKQWNPDYQGPGADD